MSASSVPSRRPPTLVVAAALTVAVALFTLLVAVLSLTSGNGTFSVGIAVAVLVWAVLVGGVGIALFLGHRWARGPVVAANLLHVFSYAEFALTEPLAAIGAVVALVAVVCAVLPATRAALTAPTD